MPSFGNVAFLFSTFDNQQASFGVTVSIGTTVLSLIHVIFNR
jgi:hypothetical protein